MASFGSIALCLHWLLRCHNKKGDSKTADFGLSDSRNLEVIGSVQFPVQHQPQHCQWQQKNLLVSTEKSLQFYDQNKLHIPRHISPWCNDNCPFITLWHNNVANTILRSSIWQKLTIFWPSKRIREKVPDPSCRPSVKFFTEIFPELTRVCSSARNTRLYAPWVHFYQGWPAQSGTREHSGKTLIN